MAFEVSKSIILDLERMVAKEQPSIFTAFEFFRREVFYPVKLLIRGFDVFSRDIIKFSVLALVGLIAMTWLTVELTQAGGGVLAQYIFPFAFFLPLIVSMFSAPSSYSFCGVKNDHLRLVFARLAKAGVSNTDQLAPIKSNIQQFENRVKVRVISLRVFMAFCWTGFAYLYSEFNKLILNSGRTPSMEDLSQISFALLGVLGLYVAIESYSKANAMIFREALIGCNEYEYVLAGEGFAYDSSNNQINGDADSSNTSSSPVI